MTRSARATGTPWLRLDGRAGWKPLEPAGGLVLDAAGMRLGVPDRRPIPDAEPSGSFGGRTLPTGVAVSPLGRVFLADPGGRRILSYVPPVIEQPRPPDADAAWPFRELWAPRDPFPAADGGGVCVPSRSARPPGDPYALIEPRDVALAPNGDLVIADTGGDTGFGRIIVLAMPSAAPRQVIHLASGAPAAIGFDHAGRAYVADTRAARIHRFDRHWCRDTGYRGGQGLFSAPAHLHVQATPPPVLERCPGGCDCETPDDAAALPAALADGTVHVVDCGALRALDPSGREREPMLPADGPLAPPALELDTQGALWFTDPPREPLRLPAIRVTRTGLLEGTSLRLLARPGRVALPRSALYLSERLEGDREGFAWHRLALEAAIPARTRLVAQTHTSDQALEPSRIAALTPAEWSVAIALPADDAGDDRPELLIQSPPGRFLWLRLELYGDGAATPLVAGIDVHAPRRSSLRLMPPPFHQDPESARFLDRLLSFSDTWLAEPGAINRDIARYLDPYAVPAGEFLDWLGSWFDWRFLAQWPEAVRREMIAESVVFFRQRGTVAGLRRILQWHTGIADPLPVVIEHHRLRDRAAGAPAWVREHDCCPLEGEVPPLYVGGLPLAPDDDAVAHHFTVVLPARAAPGETQRERIERLIHANKPAHALFAVRYVRAGLRIGRQSSLGVDAIVGGYPVAPLGEARLGQTIQPGTGDDPVLGKAVLN